MKLAFVLNSISGGGIARVITTYANELAKESSLEVFLVLLHKRDHFYAVHPKIKIIENPFKRTKLSKFFYAFTSMLFLRNTFKKLRIEKIVCNGEWINSFVFFSTFGIKKEIFFFDHSNPLRPNQSPFPFLDQFTYKRVNGVLVLSKAALEKIKNRFNQNNVCQIDNPVVLLNPTEAKKKNVIISMGRLSKEKGQDVLLTAFAKTQANDWFLQFLGDGTFRIFLEKSAKELGVINRVDFVGKKQNIEFYLSQAKIFVLPSHTENFPMALIEAMSIGLPCLVTDCMPWRKDDDFIKDSVNGIKVPVNEPEAMAEGLQRLVDSEELRAKFSEEAIKIRQLFNLEQNIKNFKNAIGI